MSAQARLNGSESEATMPKAYIVMETLDLPYEQLQRVLAKAERFFTITREEFAKQLAEKERREEAAE
jgi:hypothetical protein